MYGRIQKNLAKIMYEIAYENENSTVGREDKSYEYLRLEIANYSNLTENDREDLDEAIFLEAGWYLECISDGIDVCGGIKKFVTLIEQTGYETVAGRATHKLINELKNEEVSI